MADTSITDLSALTTFTSDSNVIVMVDVTDTTMGAGGTDKQMTVTDLLASIEAAILTFTAAAVPVAGSDGLLADSGMTYDNIYGILYPGSVQVSGNVQFHQSAMGTGVITFQAPAHVPIPYTLTWPDATGTVNQIITTDGSGNLSWTDNGAGTGNVNGPASATDTALAIYNGTTGKIIKNSLVTLSTTTLAGVTVMGIGGAANASAALDITSTTKGFGLPAMTTTQRTAIGTPKAGLQVFDSTLSQFYGYNGAAWVVLG